MADDRIVSPDSILALSFIEDEQANGHDHETGNEDQKERTEKVQAACCKFRECVHWRIMRGGPIGCKPRGRFAQTSAPIA